MRHGPDESKAVSECHRIRPLAPSEAFVFSKALLMAARDKPMRFYLSCNLNMPTGVYELDNSSMLSSLNNSAATDPNRLVKVLNGQQPSLMEVYPLIYSHRRFIVNSYDSNEKMATAVVGIKVPEPQKPMIELAKEIFNREMSLAAETSHGENKEMLTRTQSFEAKLVFWKIMDTKSD